MGAFILFEIFGGEAGKKAEGGATSDAEVHEAFNVMRLIVTAGWAIYPLGYLFGYLMENVESSVLNLIYNFADFVNKIAFVLAVWQCAKKSTIKGRKGMPLLA